MQRPRQLFRDWGLTLALVLAAVLLYWRTTVPSLRRNAELDRIELEQLDEQERLRAEVERLRAAERAAGDPIQTERVQRAQHGALGLPANERAEDS
jgi:hypothetical protein